MVGPERLHKDHVKRVRKTLSDENKAIHLVFRLLGPNFQKYFEKNFDCSKIPQVFLHGNPHLDNYARTFTGAGLVDFDRSRMGPYCWDIIRFLASLSIRGEGNLYKKDAPTSIVESFIEGYLTSFSNPDIYFVYPTFVRSMVPSESEITMRAYMDSNIKWAKKMRKNPIDIKDKGMNKMLKLYLESRGEENLLNFYQLEECGESEGSLGKMHYLFALAPKDDKDKKKDLIMIDLKETYCEKDTNYFSNPFDHHGVRMIKASNLYAPGIEQRLGHFTFDGVQYWGREIPSFNAKVKEQMSLNEQEEMAYCVGAQLGRGHRRSYREGKVKYIEIDINQNLDTYLKFARQMKEEVINGMEFFKKMDENKK